MRLEKWRERESKSTKAATSGDVWVTVWHPWGVEKHKPECFGILQLCTSGGKISEGHGIHALWMWSLLKVPISDHGLRGMGGSDSANQTCFLGKDQKPPCITGLFPPLISWIA